MRGASTTCSRTTRRPARPTSNSLARIPADYVEYIRAKAPAAGLEALDPDTAMCPETLEAALRAAGANVLAVDLVMSGRARRAFCNVRPPGHHAERSRAMGFCFFNNVAVGAAHALERHGLERVAILDFDVHLGNGTEDIFRDDGRVLLCSLYQYPLYPDMDPPSVPGHIVNCPLPAGQRQRKFPRRGHAALAAGARGVRTADDLRLGGIRRARVRPARRTATYDRRLRVDHRRRLRRCGSPRRWPARVHARGWLRPDGARCERGRPRRAANGGRDA